MWLTLFIYNYLCAILKYFNVWTTELFNFCTNILEKKWNTFKKICIGSKANIFNLPFFVSAVQFAVTCYDICLLAPNPMLMSISVNFQSLIRVGSVNLSHSCNRPYFDELMIASSRKTICWTVVVIKLLLKT